MTSRIVLTGSWLICVAAGSFLPGGWKMLLPTHGPFHLPIHFVVFAFSGYWVAGNADSYPVRMLLCSSVIGFAFILEALQRAIFPIHFEWPDFTADACGVLCALFFMAVCHSRRITSSHTANSLVQDSDSDPEAAP